MAFGKTRHYLGLAGLLVFAAFILCEIFSPMGTGKLSYSSNFGETLFVFAGLIWTFCTLHVLWFMWINQDRNKQGSWVAIGAFAVMQLANFVFQTSAMSHIALFNITDTLVTYGWPIILLINVTLPFRTERGF